MDNITLKGMAFYGYHGVSPEEHRLGQRFYVDVSMSLDLSLAGESDDLKGSVNYAEVFQRVKAVVEGESCQLLEHVAYQINEKICEAYPLVKEVTTTVHKPGAPVPGVMEDVSVSLHKKR